VGYTLQSAETLELEAGLVPRSPPRHSHDRVGASPPISSTAGLLHWFVSPYVHRLRYDPGNGWIEATRLDILARPVVTHFDIGEAQYADTMRPQSTFKVRR
jgi:hypothetical protein